MVIWDNKFFLTSWMLLIVIVYLPLKLHSEPEQAKIPTNEILQIWEYSCIKHIENGELDRAIKNLEVMNWQCDNKQYLALSKSESLDVAMQSLDTAIQARQSYLANGKRWICYPKSVTQNQTKRTFFRIIGGPVLNYLKYKEINEDIAYIIIGQIAMETSWGTRIFGNNLFNIKGEYNGESVPLITHEQLPNGQWVQITDSFRKYPSMEESLNDYLDLLKDKWSESYQVLLYGGRIENFIKGLHPGENNGYATDKAYSYKLLLLYKIVKEEMFQTDIIPTYLKCLDRENELNQLMEKPQ